MSECRKCHKHLTNDEIGIYKKLVCRTALDFLCGDCLAAYFRCDKRLIDNKIRQFPKLTGDRPTEASHLEKNESP